MAAYRNESRGARWVVESGNGRGPQTVIINSTDLGLETDFVSHGGDSMIDLDKGGPPTKEGKRMGADLPALSRGPQRPHWGVGQWLSQFPSRVVPDPDGGDNERFWNGEEWTEHRRARPRGPPLHHQQSDPGVIGARRRKAWQLLLWALPATARGRTTQIRSRRSSKNVAHSHWASPPQAKEQARVSESSASDSAGIAPKAAPELTPAVIESLKMKGYSQSDIARMYGVSRQAVSWHKRHYGGRLAQRDGATAFPMVSPH